MHIKKLFKKKKKNIFMDYASGTPIKKEVLKTMLPYLSEKFHNPGGIYQESFIIKKVLEETRKNIAKILSVQASEIIFTDGGTEANNLAIQGIVEAWKKEHPKEKAHIITSSIEHASILETCKKLTKNNKAEVSHLSVDERGLISLKELKKEIRENTVLISIGYVNGEIGVIQNIREIAKTIRHHRKHHKTVLPYFHSDAIQATNYLPLNMQKLGVDLLSINASKIYGPKKIALLYKKKNVPLEAIIYGGNQELGLRAGTENIPSIIGFAEALTETQQIQEKEYERMRKLQKFAEKLLKEELSSSFVINGEKSERIPNIVNISIPRLSSEEIVLRLDVKGIKASVKSACKSGEFGDSHVIQALRRENTQSIRFSFGHKTTKKEITYMVKTLAKIEKNMIETYQKYIK